MSAYFRSARTSAYFSDPATFSNAAPVFSIASISPAGPYQEGDQITLNVENRTGAMTGALDSGALTADSQTTSTFVFTIPSLLSHGDTSSLFNTPLTITLNDGTTNATIDLTVAPADNYYFAEVVELAGFYLNAAMSGVAVGDYAHVRWSSGGGEIGDLSRGSISPDETGAVLEIMIYDISDNTWSDSAGSITYAAPLVDTENPTITLIGNASVSIVEGDSYTDAGANVTDNVDANSVIAGVSNVNVNTVGNYTVTFNYTDVAGNPATQVVRTVEVTAVADTEVPVITLIGNATIELTVGDSYTDAGANVTDNVDAGSVLVGNSNVNTNVIGNYTVTFDYTDGAGNPAIQVVRTVNVVAAVVTPISESTGNPLPLSFGINTTYSLAQHITNPDSAALNYTVSTGTLPTGVTLNATTGVLTKEVGAVYDEVSGLSFSVVIV